MKLGFAKKVIIKAQGQFMYGSNFYGSDVSHKTFVQYWTISDKYNQVLTNGHLWTAPQDPF